MLEGPVEGLESVVIEERLKLMVKDESVVNKAEASNIQKFPPSQKEQSIAEEDSEIKRLKQRLANDTSNS